MLYAYSLTIFQQFPMISKACDNLVPSYLPLTSIENRPKQKLHTIVAPFHCQAKYTKYFLAERPKYLLFTKRSCTLTFRQLKSLPSLPVNSDTPASEISSSGSTYGASTWNMLCYIAISLVLQRQ